MAGDWIKMRADLQSHPKVVRILSATKTDKFRVLGGLHAVWAIFDTHSIDGELKGYTPEALDHVIGWDGFSRAMESVAWLSFDGAETLKLPEFDTHNGQSAKRRAEDQKRKKNSRNSVRNLSADVADENRTREEKRREEKEHAQKVARFDEFWSEYPRAEAKKPAAQIWKTRKLDRVADSILADVRRRVADGTWTDRKFIPLPTTYLNQERWTDEPAARNGAGSEMPEFMRGAI